MDIVRIPHVNLVDSYGRDIGKYSDDSNWWQTTRQKLAIGGPLVNNENENGDNQDALSSVDVRRRASKIEYEEDMDRCNVIGETPLHVAIVYNDFLTVQMLIEEKGYDVNQRTITRTEFKSGFQSRTTAHLIAESKYEGLAYYGEYPLSFAACFADKKIYDYLIDKGADPNKQGTFKQFKKKLFKTF
jgi:ankyrin repeat protein